MIYQDVQRVLRRILPGRFAEAVRAAGTAVLTPAHFAITSGHFRSSLRRRALDRAGSPLPWYTYPAIDFLAARRFDGRAVLEFGAGQSTLWWSRRAGSVLALESDPAWAERLRPQLPPHARLHLVPRDLAGLAAITAGRRFDIIVVDGLDRLRAAEAAVDLLAEDGAILFDNAEQPSGAPGFYPIHDLLRDRGFSRIDFYGHCPGVILPHCTSCFFRGTTFLVRPDEPPKLRVS
jgi:hypothetical protein